MGNLTSLWFTIYFYILLVFRVYNYFWNIFKRTQGCRDARLEIRLDATGDGDIFCGQRSNSLKNDVIDGIVYRAFLPFRIYVITETAQSADGVTDIGFALKYYQVIAFYLHQYH